MYSCQIQYCEYNVLIFPLMFAVTVVSDSSYWTCMEADDHVTTPFSLVFELSLYTVNYCLFYEYSITS